MQKLFLIPVLGLLMASCTGEPGASEQLNGQAAPPSREKAGSVSPVNSQEAKDLLAQDPSIEILDVRTPGEFAEGRVKGARLVDFNAPDFLQQLQGLDRAKPYLIYCAVGGRSGRAARQMEQLGFSKVYEASQGFASLQQAGIPVE